MPEQIETYSLTASRVDDIFTDCLFRDGEHTDCIVTAEGVMLKVGFHPERLEFHKDEIKRALHQLSDDFREDIGGGMSFLNACVTRNGDQWGGHQSIDQLLVLGCATGLATIQLPRSMWHILPGGVPYFCVAA